MKGVEMDFACRRCGGRKHVSFRINAAGMAALLLFTVAACFAVLYFFYGAPRWIGINVAVALGMLIFLSRLRIRCPSCEVESADPYRDHYPDWQTMSAGHDEDEIVGEQADENERDDREQARWSRKQLLVFAAKAIIPIPLALIWFIIQFGYQAATIPGCWSGLFEYQGEVFSERWLCPHVAAADGDTALLRTLDANGHDLEAKNGYGRTPLYEAAKRGQLEAVNHLIAWGANTNHHGSHRSFTPVHVAAEYRHPEVLSLLLENGGNPNARGFVGITPIGQATWKPLPGAEEVYVVLLRHGADIDLPSYRGWTPLHRAADHGYESRLRFLIEHGAQLDALTGKGNSALSLSIDEGYTEIARVLLEAGADVEASANHWTPLWRALRNGNKQQVELLKQHGASGSKEFFGLVTRANAAWHEGDYAEYIRITDRALELNDRYAPLFRWRAQAFGMMRRFDDAEREIDRYLSLKPGDRSGETTRLHLLMTSGRFADALPLIEAMLEKWPGSGYAWMARGYLRLRQDHDMGGLDDIERACDLGEKKACEMLAHARRHRVGDWFESLDW